MVPPPPSRAADDDPAPACSPARSDPAGLTPSMGDRERETVARALADPRRFQILQQIGAAGDSLPCSALVCAHPVTAATISHHLKELEAAGLIAIRREGKNAHLSIRRDCIAAFAEAVRSL